MKGLYLLCLSILTEASQRHRSGGRPAAVNTNASAMVYAFNHRIDLQTHQLSDMDIPVQRFSSWSRWSECRGGHRKRRKHCVSRRLCGDSMRVEVKSCQRRDYGMGLHEAHMRRHEVEEVPDTLAERVPQMRQMVHGEEIQKRFRGFSPWSPWSTCSRKCTTVRRRYCRRPAFCGRRVVRQSAYCYVDGGFCQRWIRGRMQRRKDQGNAVRESMPAPALAIHPEDERTSQTAAPSCGKLGRSHGPAADRLRARMRDMVRIIGGRPAAPGKWPWQVAVLNRYKEAFCGGTLVSLRWVVTAAHCVRKRLYVRLGEHDLMLPDRGQVELKVQEAVVHPQYDPDTVVNDVAMLRLPEAARPSLGHGVACLPRENQPLAPHASCVILGWGKRRATDVHGTRILHEAQVSTIQQGVCRRSYWQYAITDDMVCAGRGRRDSCAGDSGGPLLCRDRSLYYLQGITSFGDGCGKRGKYGIYTRTAGYVSWMDHVMSHKYFDD